MFPNLKFTITHIHTFFSKRITHQNKFKLAGRKTPQTVLPPDRLTNQIAAVSDSFISPMLQCWGSAPPRRAVALCISGAKFDHDYTIKYRDDGQQRQKLPDHHMAGCCADWPHRPRRRVGFGVKFGAYFCLQSAPPPLPQSDVSGCSRNEEVYRNMSSGFAPLTSLRLEQHVWELFFSRRLN